MSTPWELKIAWRYFRSARSDSLISLLSRIAACGLALGVAALILALAALSGFQQRLLEDVRAHSATLQIGLKESTNTAALRQLALGLDDVVAAQEVVYGQGWLSRRNQPMPAEIVGYENELPEWIPKVELWGSDGLVISTTRARRWALLEGAVLEVITPRGTQMPWGLMPSSRRLELIGLHDPGSADEGYEDLVAMPLRLANGLVAGADRWLDLRLKTSDEIPARRALEAALAASEGLRGLQVRSWRDSNRALLFVFRLEKTAIFLAVVLIVLVASFALVSALSLILATKQPEIGILSAMGAGSGRVRRVFLLLGGLLASFGVAGGAALGIGASWLLERFRLLPLPGDVYVVDHLPFLLRAGDVGVVLAATFLVTVIAAGVGSKKAASLQPVEAMRR